MVRTATRAFDHLYDVVYTSSHPVDHQRATGRALFRPDKFKRVPDDKYLFSELPHYPRATIRADNKDQLPEHVDRRWHPATAPTYDASLEAVSGRTRPLYFKRPVVPTLADLPNMVHYEMSKPQTTMPMSQTVPTQAATQQTVVGTRAEEVVVDGPLTVGTQTLYRESEAQTVPYSPEVLVAPGHEPEVLTLTHLQFGAGLPASKLEIEIIERTRQKRIFDAMLPPPTDEYGYMLRSGLMEEQEFREWSDRENKIKSLQDKRLKLLVEALHGREDKVANRHAEKVERLRKMKEEERDRVLATTQRKRVQVLRKMFKERQKASAICENKPKKRDVIAEYADFTSTVYAPLRREGHIPDTKTARIEVQPADLSTYQGLVQLEKALPPSTFKVRIEAPGDDASKRKDPIEIALAATMGKITKEAAGEAGPSEAGAEDRKKKVARAIFERPETPRVKEDVLPEEEQQQAAVLMMQRILRGRARQNVMFEGKEKRLDLINELRAAELWNAASTTDGEKKAVAALRERALEAGLESVVGGVVSETLDQLSKELLRFQEERRIAAMVKLAEKDRRLRQAQESGRRQAEERLRDREDKMFRQMMNVHQTTVDSYLEEVLSQSVDQAAKSRALTEARIKAQEVNQTVDRLEQTYQDEQATVRELVASFLLPHVQRGQLQRRLKVEEQRFSRAAMESLDKSLTEVCKDFAGEH
jgi:hypothetical protein